MTYTAEQLRERARNLRANGHPMGAHECEAHADALEMLNAVNTTLVHELGGIVEGRPTHRLNYLQRVRELRQKESELERLNRIKQTATVENMALIAGVRQDDVKSLMAAFIMDSANLKQAKAELVKLRQKLMRYEHAEAADILYPPQEETK